MHVALFNRASWPQLRIQYSVPSLNQLRSCLCALLDHQCSIIFCLILPSTHSKHWLILQSLLVGLILLGSDLTKYTLPPSNEAGTGLSLSKSLLNRLASKMTGSGSFRLPCDDAWIERWLCDFKCCRCGSVSVARFVGCGLMPTSYNGPFLVLRVSLILETASLVLSCG